MEILTGSRSPLSREEARDLIIRLSGSPLVTKVSTTLNIENPILETTDWTTVEEATKAFKKSTGHLG